MEVQNELHNTPSKLSRMTVIIRNGVTHPQFDIAGKGYQVEDWWDRVAGISWMDAEGNPACLIYAIRSAMQAPKIPIDNKVLYGKIDGLGVLIHVSEIEGEEVILAQDNDDNVVFICP